MKIDTYRNLIDQIAAAVLILDEKRIVQYANQDSLDLLGFQMEEQFLGFNFDHLISKEQLAHFQTFYQSIIEGKESHESIYSLVRRDDSIKNVLLSGSAVENEAGYISQTIWTLKDISAFNNFDNNPDQIEKLEDLAWLSEQGRHLLSMKGREDILDFAGKALQEKLGDCIILTLSHVDESNLRLDGIYGIETKLLNKVWTLSGGDQKGRSFPLEDRFKDAYSRRKLSLHPGGLDNFSKNQVKPKITQRIAKLVGVEDVYTIGLEGNSRVMGVFYIFTTRPNMIPNEDLVESFTFQAALALEKAGFAGDLESSKQQFKVLFENAPDGYFISDLQGNILDGNREAERITGFSREDLIGKNFLNTGILSKTQLPRASKLLGQVLRGKSTGPNGFILNRKDGSQIEVDISTHPAKIGNKNVVLGIARDISEQKQIEENLEQAHGTLTRVLGGIDAHVYVADLDSFEILYMNKSMIEDFGGDYTGKICYELFRGAQEKCQNCTNNKLLDDRGKPGDVQIWEGRNQKTGKWYRNYDRAIYWTDQRIVRMQIAVDITESKQSSSALEKSEERYRSLFQTSQNALMTLSPPSWNFTSGNPALVELFGLENEGHFLTYKPWELSPNIQPDGRKSKEKAQEMIRIAQETGSHFFHWTHKRVDGEEFPATVHLTRVEFSDEEFLQATIRDITDQKQAEDKLQQQMEDLALLNALNVAANQGKELGEIYSLFARDAKRIFSSRNTAVNLLSDDGSHLHVNLLQLDQSIITKVEKITGISLPESLEISIGKDSIYRKLLDSGETHILKEQDEIVGIIKDYLSAAFLPKRVKQGLYKLIPKIYQIIGIRSVIVAPLMMAGKSFGLIDISSANIFSEDEKDRFSAIAEQLSGFIQRIRTEKERTDNLVELELIYRTFVEGSRLEEVDDICKHLADKIQEVNPDCYVMVTLFDPEVEAIRVRALTDLGKKAGRLLKILGAKPEDFRVKVGKSKIDKELNALFTSGKLELVPEGLYDLTRREIPRSVCKSAEKLMGVDEVYIAGFGLDKKSSGGLILFVKEDKKVNFPAAIETIVNHFAVIFERRQVQSEVLERTVQLEALREVELSIVSQLDLKELLHSIANKTKSIVNGSACGFSVYNKDRDVLEYLAYVGFDELPDNTDMEYGEGLSGKVWETGETIIVENYAEWEGRSEPWVPVSNYYLAGIPVLWGDEFLGVLEIALDPSDKFLKSDIEMMELFATQAAIAIKNARLFSEETMRRKEAETLREVGVLINSMVARPELLDMILSSLQKVVPFSSASIQLVKGSEIVIEAFQGSDFHTNVKGTSFIINENKLAERILFNGEKVILNMKDEIDQLLEGPGIDKTHSWLAVPLESKGNRIGILTLDHHLPNQYSQQDLTLVADFATQAVVALENNHLIEELRRRTNEIEAVYESALRLTQELQPEALYNYLYNQIEPLFAPDAFILATCEPGSDMIRVSYATEVGIRQQQVEGLNISPEQKNSLLSWIIRNKSPLLIGNVETETLPVQPEQVGRTIRSWLGVPLLVGNRIVGGLVVQSYDSDAYTRDHQRLLQLMGNQFAIALENSRLFDNAQRRLSRLSSLREIDQAISGSVDITMTMHVLVEQLISTLEVDAACVLLYNNDNQSLDIVNTSGFKTDSFKDKSLRLGEGLAGKAALDRSLIHIPDLTGHMTSFQGDALFEQEGFITYLANPLIAKGELVGVLEVFHRERLDPDPEWLDFLDALARAAAIAIDRLNLLIDLEKSNIELIQAYDATIEGWATAIELRDGDTGGHSRRTVKLTMNLARKMGVKGDELTHIRRGVLLHDIGKMAIPDGILLKSGKLTDEEWLVMKKHPVFAYEMLSSINYLKPALDIPYCHHEFWDGSGYPRGLSGESIPLAARIFAVVDVWDALQSNRPYRKAWSEKQAIKFLKEQSGIQFDPQVVDAFFELINETD